VTNPEEYKIFIEELKKFGVSSSNMKDYLTFIQNFGVEYKDIKNFTVYISKVGVTWATFPDFISALQNFGVRMKYFIEFMCYIYSFGIVYEASSKSVFFRFLASMQKYQMDYNTIAGNGKPNFINAMDVFMLLLNQGNTKIECGDPMKIINNPPQIKYVELYFDEGKPTSGRMIPFPLEAIVKTVQTIDGNMSDFKNANSFHGSNLNRPQLFTSYAKIENNKLVLNEDHSDKQLLYRTMYSFLNKLVLAYSQTNQTDMLKMLFMTGFMIDKDFQTYITSKTISFNKLAELTDQIESWNKGNNNKTDTINAYNEVTDMLNIMKIFPDMCIELLKKYASGPDFNIPNDPKITTRAQNPKNIRCPPYIKVAYNEADCATSTLIAFTTLQQSQLEPNTISTISPVQITQHKQYGGHSSAKPLGSSLTINNTFYSAYGGKNQYSYV
jgi:hypothetical protein